VQLMLTVQGIAHAAALDCWHGLRLRSARHAVEANIWE
jgi:hypothetical protein